TINTIPIIPTGFMCLLASVASLASAVLRDPLFAHRTEIGAVLAAWTRQTDDGDDPDHARQGYRYPNGRRHAGSLPDPPCSRPFFLIRARRYRVSLVAASAT